MYGSDEVVIGRHDMAGLPETGDDAMFDAE
jgi:hypothetical protein